MALTKISSTKGIKGTTANRLLGIDGSGSADIKEVQASGDQIADDGIAESKLQISNAGTNGQFLQKSSGTGGLTWATATTDTSDKASLSGATFTGDISLGDNDITNVGEISLDKIKPDGSTVFLNMGTDKNILFQGDIGEIGDVTGFQAVNDAASANTSFGIRATDIRFATGSAERFRVGSSGQLGIAGATYGSSGQVLTSGGASAAPSWTTISAAPEVTLTASGTVTADKAAMIKSDGTVETVAGVSLSSGSTTEIRSITNGDSANQSASAFGNGKFVVIYAQANDLYAKAATLSGTTFSFGSELQVTNDLAGNPYNTCDVCYDSNADKFVVVWSTTTSKAVSRVLSVSGTTLSQGTKNNIYNNPSTYYVQETQCIFDPSVNKVCAVYNIGSGKLCQAKAGTVSGTSISWGGAQEVDDGGGNVNNVNLAYDSKNENIYVVWRFSNSSGRISKITYNSSTGQYPRTHAVSVWISSAPSGYIGIVAIPNTDKVLSLIHI